MINLSSVPERQCEWREYEKGSLTESGLALNETASFIWKYCDGKTKVSEIVKLLVGEFEVSREVAEKEVRDCLNLLVEESAIILR